MLWILVSGSLLGFIIYMYHVASTIQQRVALDTMTPVVNGIRWTVYYPEWFFQTLTLLAVVALFGLAISVARYLGRPWPSAGQRASRWTTVASFLLPGMLFLYAVISALTNGIGVQMWVIPRISNLLVGYPAYPSSIILFSAFAVSMLSFGEKGVLMALFAAGSYDSLTSIAYKIFYHPPPNVMTISAGTFAYWGAMWAIPLYLARKFTPSLRQWGLLGAATAVSMVIVKFADWFRLNDPNLHIPAVTEGLMVEVFVEAMFCGVAFLVFRRQRGASSVHAPSGARMITAQPCLGIRRPDK